jgi:stage II sporulation protein E
MIYLATNLFFIVYLNARDYLIEIIIVTLVMLVIPKKFFYYIRKLIIDPKDYQIKRYQENYYHSLQKNLRIQKIITYLQDKIKNNPRMRKSSKEIILSNMNFLNNKLKEEENDDYKETIIARLNNHDIETISLKICSDFLNSYSVFIETSKSEEEAIKNILEDILNVRLKREKKYIHKLINSYRYVFVNEEKINFNLAIKQRSKEANSCGDSYLKFYTKNKKYLLISDGMGHGKKASKDSSEALHLLENFIELGMSPKDAIVSCNALIYDKNKEIFNTLDLLEYDCFNNKAYLYKNGSGVTYLKNSESVEKIISENLPLGIVENIKVDKLTLDIDSGYIILTSDGVKKDLTEMLKNMNDKKANLVSNEILNYEGEKVEDDQTIVVINVIKKEGV